MLSPTKRRTPMHVSSPYGTGHGGRGERRELVVNGTLTPYWCYGPQQTGRTLVMVHGFRGDHHGLEQVAAQLTDERVVVPDLPGFGTSAAFVATPHTVAAYADWVNSFVAQLPDAGDVVLLGHSFGSVVVAAALADGSSASRAVLVNPIGAPALSGPRGLLSRLALLYYQLSGILSERAGDALLRSPLVVQVMSAVLSTSRDPLLRGWILAEHLRYFNVFANRQSVLEAFAASVGDDVSAYAGQVTIPVLLVGGQRDDITPVGVQERLASRFPDATLVMIPDVGHLIHYEAPKPAAQAIQAFLQVTRR